jgi:hypothetical protein
MAAEEKRRLTTRDLTESALAAYGRSPQVDRAAVDLALQAAELHGRIKVFEAAVWFPRLQAQVDATDSRGMSGSARGVKVMTRWGHEIALSPDGAVTMGA